MDLFRRMVRWRVGLGWYVVALGLPLASTLAATSLNVLLGAEGPTSAELPGGPASSRPSRSSFSFPVRVGAWEEPGWRGYAPPRLQTRRSALVASLILGALVAAWHLPLMVEGQVHFSDSC